MEKSAYLSNRLLASLPPPDIAVLEPHLQTVQLPRETVLFETGDTIGRIYFPLSGIVSLVVDLSSGEMIEAAMIGREGVVGGLAALDGQISINRAVVQVGGAASVLATHRVRELADQSVSFRNAVIRYEQVLLAQSQQSAACNAVHALESRLARWLLRARDLVGSEDVPLTEVFISQMMGVRRISFSVIARMLQQAGLIHYSRGHIRVLNVRGLRETACECYQGVRAISDRLLGPSEKLDG